MSFEADNAIEKARYYRALYRDCSPWQLSKRIPSVEVVHAELGEGIKGYTLVSRRQCVITLCYGMAEHEEDGTLIHELGHVISKHVGTNYFYRSPKIDAAGSSEYVANCFAFQYLFGDRGGVNPMSYCDVLAEYGFQGWMAQYFNLIN